MFDLSVKNDHLHLLDGVLYDVYYHLSIPFLGGVFREKRTDRGTDVFRKH